MSDLTDRARSAATASDSHRWATELTPRHLLLEMAGEIERLQAERDTAQSAAVNAIREDTRLRAEILRLQEIVGRLPTDAAGDPICPGDVGFAVRRPVFGGASHVTEFRVDAIERDGLRNWQVGFAKPSEFHRTREAAEKARTT